ncbi:hypothetical protein LCGC14_3069220, partial [marine sediment metagenome]
SEIRLLEPDAGMIEVAKSKLAMHNNVTYHARPLEGFDPPEQADLIVCVHAIYAMPDQKERLRDLRRLLRPGGWLYLVDLGRHMDVADWRSYLFSHLKEELGLVRALRVFWQGREIAKKNAAILKAQKQGAYWTHTEAEMAAEVTAAGFEIYRQQSVYRGYSDLLMLAAGTRRVADVAFGLAMRDYGFEDHKSAPKPRKGSVEVMCSKPDDAREEAAPLMAVAEGAFMTRDLTNAPANILTTTSFAERLAEMESLGLKVEVLDEEELASLGMRTLLSVGQGSDSPSKVVVMRWDGGAEGNAPLALVGKGVVFDTGGISLKPGAGMEDMTMDMGGAGVVSGVMRTLALRKAKA